MVATQQNIQLCCGHIIPITTIATLSALVTTATATVTTISTSKNATTQQRKIVDISTIANVALTPTKTILIPTDRCSSVNNIIGLNNETNNNNNGCNSNNSNSNNSNNSIATNDFNHCSNVGNNVNISTNGNNNNTNSQLNGCGGTASDNRCCNSNTINNCGCCSNNSCDTNNSVHNSKLENNIEATLATTTTTKTAPAAQLGCLSVLRASAMPIPAHATTITTATAMASAAAAVVAATDNYIIYQKQQQQMQKQHHYQQQQLHAKQQHQQKLLQQQQHLFHTAIQTYECKAQQQPLDMTLSNTSAIALAAVASGRVDAVVGCGATLTTLTDVHNNLESEYSAMVAAVYEHETTFSDCASVASDLTHMYVSDEDDKNGFPVTHFN